MSRSTLTLGLHLKWRGKVRRVICKGRHSQRAVPVPAQRVHPARVKSSLLLCRVQEPERPHFFRRPSVAHQHSFESGSRAPPANNDILMFDCGYVSEALPRGVTYVPPRQCQIYAVGSFLYTGIRVYIYKCANGDLSGRLKDVLEAFSVIHRV